MRTTLDLDDDLLAEATRLTGVTTKTTLVENGLRELIAKESRRRLAALRGQRPDVEVPPRRRAASRR